MQISTKIPACLILMRDYYQEIKDILGTQCAIVPIGDPVHENAAHTTVTSVGNGNGDGLVFTYSGDRRAFTPATDYRRNQIHLPDVGFDGAANELDSPDATFWSRGDGSDDSPVTLGVWLVIAAASSFRTILAKWVATEWLFRVTASEEAELIMRDSSAGVQASRVSSVLPTGQPVFVAVTYDGAGGASAADTINFYVNGVLANGTASNNANYVAMENGTAVLSLGFRPTLEFFGDRMLGGPLGPFYTQDELPAAQVLNLDGIGLAAQQEQRSRSLAWAL